jgi:hypothetical protein
MSTVDDYLTSLPDDAEEVDVLSFERIEEFDDETWVKLWSNKRMKRLKLPPSLRVIWKGRGSVEQFFHE